jgi:hypothetical protein
LEVEGDMTRRRTQITGILAVLLAAAPGPISAQEDGSGGRHLSIRVAMPASKPNSRPWDGISAGQKAFFSIAFPGLWPQIQFWEQQPEPDPAIAVLDLTTGTGRTYYPNCRDRFECAYRDVLVPDGPFAIVAIDVDVFTPHDYVGGAIFARTTDPAELDRMFTMVGDMLRVSLKIPAIDPADVYSIGGRPSSQLPEELPVLDIEECVFVDGQDDGCGLAVELPDSLGSMPMARLYAAEQSTSSRQRGVAGRRGR